MVRPLGRVLRHAGGRVEGFALPLALVTCVVLSILVFAVTGYVTSNEKSATLSTAAQVARGYAESALNLAYSRINYANSTTGLAQGLTPSQPTLLGCGTGSSGASDCSSITPYCASFTASCPSPTYAPTAGTASVYGYFTGTNSGSFDSISAPASTWVIVATGYAPNGSGTVAKTLRGTVTISASSAGAVAAVWNHVFLTAPLVSGQCQQSFTGNSLILDAPMYVIGNLCMLGNGEVLEETTQPVDLMVGGRLVLGGSGSSQAAVGNWSSNPAVGITSGVVVGGCSSTIGGATSACAGGSWHYKVNSTDTFISQADPALSDAKVESDYSSFDPGPDHTCQSGTTPSPLTASQFDNNIATGEGTSVYPDNSGSGGSGTAFNLTPSTSYACISKNGTSTGYLIWNAGSSSLTVSGITVPAKTLAINGSVFFDSPLTISQSMTYQGTGIIMVAGQVSLTGSNMTVCAINTNCSFTNWQGSSGHNDMLTIASVLKSSSTAIAFVGNSITFQGSLWAQTSSQIEYVGNSCNTQGPMATGGLNVVANSFKLQPLPVIKNMPVGAPVPPNVSASISPLSMIG